MGYTGTCTVLVSYTGNVQTITKNNKSRTESLLQRLTPVYPVPVATTVQVVYMYRYGVPTTTSTYSVLRTSTVQVRYSTGTSSLLSTVVLVKEYIPV